MQVSQRNAATYLRCSVVGRLIWVLLQIYLSLQQRMNFANQSRIDTVTAMVTVAHLFDSLCSECFRISRKHWFSVLANFLLIFTFLVAQMVLNAL